MATRAQNEVPAGMQKYKGTASTDDATNFICELP